MNDETVVSQLRSKTIGMITMLCTQVVTCCRLTLWSLLACTLASHAGVVTNGAVECVLGGASSKEKGAWLPGRLC